MPLFEGFGNGKTIPAYQLLFDIEKGECSAVFQNGWSCRRPAIPVANIAQMMPWFGGIGVIAVVDENVSPGKIGQILIANKNVEIIKAQAGQSTIELARRIAEKRRAYFVDQYTAKKQASLGHENIPWPHVAKQLSMNQVEPAFVCAASWDDVRFRECACFTDPLAGSSDCWNGLQAG